MDEKHPAYSLSEDAIGTVFTETAGEDQHRHFGQHD